jgi:hypothetical protein
LSVGTSEGRCAPFCALGHGEVLHALLLHHLLLLLLLHLDKLRVCSTEESKNDWSSRVVKRWKFKAGVGYREHGSV